MFITKFCVVKKIRNVDFLKSCLFLMKVESTIAYSTAQNNQIVTLPQENNNNNDTQAITNFSSKLTEWAINNNISHIAFSQLLKILKENNVQNLPKNSRTLLNAKENEIKVSELPPGVYVHYGLEKNLRTLISTLISKNLLISTDINISVFIDNLPLSNFTRQGLWTILASISNFSDIIFLVGAYYGYSKPCSSNLFLKKFVEEAKHLLENGLVINNTNYRIIIQRVICDAPAKAFVLNIRHHSGFSSCTKCSEKGEHKEKNICFPKNSTPRSNEDFEQNDIYIKEKTKLLEIPNFGVVTNVPLDYMHLVCTGTVKQLMSMWMKENNYWMPDKIKILKINNYAEFTPKEFSYTPKPLTLFNRWKPSEFRQFLLYNGPILLKNSLKKEYYNHFLALHIACRIFSRENVEEELFNIGKSLLTQFVETLIVLYGKEKVTHNVHGLYHLADDYKLHGPLDKFSAFQFEDFLLKLRRKMKLSRKSVRQLLLKHTSEKIFHKSLNSVKSKNFQVIKKLENNVSEHNNSKNCVKYEKLKINNWEIIPDTKSENYVLLENGKIIEVTSIMTQYENSNKNIYISGKEFLSVSDFYTAPVKSSLLDIYKVSNPSKTNFWPAKLIKRKCMNIPTEKDEHIIIALLDQDF